MTVKSKSLFYILVVLAMLNTATLWAYNTNTYTLKAEMAIIHQDEESALKLYDTSFSLYEPLSIDLYNATVCAIHLNNWKSAEKYIGKLAAIGVDPRFFNRGVFVPLHDKINWASFTKKADMIKRKKDKKSVALRMKIDSLIHIDTSVRNQIHKEGYTSAIPDSLTREISLVAEDLIEIIKKDGYVNEKILGTLYNEKDSGISNYDIINKLYSVQFNSLDLKNSDTLEQIILGAMAKNQIRPFDMEDIVSFSVSQNFHGTIPFFEMFAYKDNKLYIHKSALYYDYYRQYWGLGSMEDEKDRVMFNLKPNDFIIREVPAIKIDEKTPDFIKAGFEHKYVYSCDVI